MSEAEGSSVHVEFDRATVDLDAIQRAAYALAAGMTIDISMAGPKYVCTLYPRGSTTSAEDLGHALRSEVNDQTLRQRIANETEPLRNLIFALAFSETGLTDDSLPS
jgi:His-Xaa-Ser system protein HxsD